MAPIRTKHTTEPSSSHRKKNHHPTSHTETSTPGVQKLKSSLRQARRLLSKDNIGADLRIETERRVKAIEGDIARGETSRKERTLALRYHKIKFFERQKVTRRITQTKKTLSSCAKSELKTLEKALFALRVDLNYISHYPKLKKYISLFPPEVRQGKAGSHSEPNPEAETVNKERAEIRAWIREQMERGDLSAEPELDIADARDDKNPFASTWPGEARKHKGAAKTLAKTMDVDADDFFGEDSDGHESNRPESSGEEE